MTDEADREIPPIKRLIVGLGNELLKDDGIGVHVIRALQSQTLEGVQLAEIGTAILSYLHTLESVTHILVIDAMQAGGEPGSIYLTQIDQLSDNPIRLTLHQMGLVGAFRLLDNPQRPKIDIIGVEPQTIEYGMELSPDVECVIPKVVQFAKEWINQSGN